MTPTRRRGGWFKDRRRHQEAAKKGWQGRERGYRAPTNAPQRARSAAATQPPTTAITLQKEEYRSFQDLPDHAQMSEDGVTVDFYKISDKAVVGKGVEEKTGQKAYFYFQEHNGMLSFTAADSYSDLKQSLKGQPNATIPPHIDRKLRAR